MLKKHTFCKDKLATRCMRLLLVAPLWAALMTGAAAPALAESYRAFAERILNEPPAGAVVARDLEAAILDGLNSYRKSKGRKPLASGPPELVMAARAHALDQLMMGKVGHVASTGHGFESRMRAVLGQAMFLPAMAENAARDRRAGLDSEAKARALMEQWIKSPRHRKSLTDRSYVSVAIGAVRLGDQVYAVQIFSAPQVKTNITQGN